MTHRASLSPHGPYSLAASKRFVEGFAPAAMPASADGDPEHLHIAFCVEGSWAPVAVCIRQHAADGEVTIEWSGDDDDTDRNPATDAVVAQVARILSLDVDGSGFAAIGARDPFVAELQARYAGLRPVLFWSPYEAACWAVISQRIRIAQAAAIKARITRDFGHPVAICGEEMHAFCAPATLVAVAPELALPGVKQDRLAAIAAHAAAGAPVLLADHLRSEPAAAALEELQTLPGIGPFSAEHVLVRGAGAPDWFPGTERRLLDSMRTAYARPDAGLAELATIADGWRPFRSWVSVLIRTAREDETGEIGGQTRRSRHAADPG